MIANLPKQKIGLAKKRENKFQWGKDTMNAYIQNIDWGTTSETEYRKFYDLYYGKLEMDVYKYVTNPYNFPDWKKFNMPAKVRNYNIIKPVVDLLIGEHLKRPFNYKVVVKNFDAPNKMKEGQTEMLNKLYQQMFINDANEQGIDTGLPSREVQEPQEAVKAFQASYDDMRAANGQDALDYIMYDLELPDKFQDAFFHWCITGKVISYKGVSFDDIEYDVVPPYEIYHDNAPGVKYIEDGEYVVRKLSVTANQLVDNFYDVLTEEDMEYIQNPSSNDIVSAVFGSNNKTASQTMTLYHVVWKSFKKKGILTYTDENGTIQEMEVSEGYKMSEDQGDLNIDWFWVNDVWEGYRLDNDRYIDIKQLEFLRESTSNISKVKLPYNGRVYAEEHDSLVSIVSLGEPFQILYNVFHFMLEKTINKNRDKLALMDINMIPKKGGWDEDKFMYYADAFSWAFVDSTAETSQGDKPNFNQFNVLDMSLSQYIARQFELLIAVKQEYEDLIGVTRQRKGNIMASDTVGGTERAVFQSAVTSEDHFKKFESFRTREMQGLLDLTKFAWRDGKKGTFLDADLRNKMLDIDPMVMREADLGLFATDSADEMNKLEQLKGVALEFAQNGSDPSTIAAILDSNNFAKIRTKLKEVEEAKAKMEQAIAERETQSAAALEKTMSDRNEDTQAHEIEMQDKELIRTDRELDIKEMVARGKIIEGEGKLSNEADKTNATREGNKIKKDTEEKKIKSQVAKKSI